MEEERWGMTRPKKSEHCIIASKEGSKRCQPLFNEPTDGTPELVALSTIANGVIPRREFDMFAN